MWWFGFEAQVVPGAPCRPLLLPPGHELLLRFIRAPARLLARIGEEGISFLVAYST
jgi:hypothetical protein